MITFKKDKDGCFVARLGDFEVQATPRRGLDFFEYDKETVVPCDDDDCPDNLNPDDIDACVETCKYRKVEDCISQSSSLFGPNFDMAQGIRQFRNQVAANQPDSWSDDAKKMANEDWSINGTVYPAKS